jgi:antitoxin component HigA of HigAB toxin-antitoxin module
MIRMELTPEEAEILRESLESYFSDLRMEIAGTESMVFREILKKKEAFLLRIIQQLNPDSS